MKSKRKQYRIGRVQQIYQKTDDLWLSRIQPQPLWRYISYETMFCYMAGKVFIPSIDKLRAGDPFEGHFPAGIAEFNLSLANRYSDQQRREIEKYIREKRCTKSELELIERNDKTGRTDYWYGLRRKHYLNVLRETRYAWCWFASGIESALMWNSYGKAGVAVGTTVGKLKLALEKSGRDFVFGRMAYFCAQPNSFDSEDSLHRRLLTMPYFLKREEYKGEQEIRFVTTGPGNDLMLDIPPIDWITEFRLHPKTQPSEAEAIKSVVKKMLPKITCEPSNLSQATDDTILNVCELSRELDNSDFLRWRDGSDQIPACLKNDGPEQCQAV